MQNILLMKYVKPYAFSFFFSAAMMALVWITMTYGSFHAAPIAAGVCAVFYGGLALAALVNLFRGNTLFSGSAADVLSVSTQKKIRAAGIAVALPALLYCAIFAYLVKSYEPSEAFDKRVASFERFEESFFGQSKIWEVISNTYGLAPAQIDSVSVQNDIDFGPFMAALELKIKSEWSPPKRSDSNRALVLFTLDKNGNASRIRLEKSTGSELGDQAALDAVEHASPFRHLPQGAPETVDVSFTFDYNVSPAPLPVSSNENGDDEEENIYVQGDSFSSSSTF
ncbi:MAG: energy transducer TonB [Candidatus Melainabacteria bacterium]|nr:energy transducer TonB [Candidatus Melainabacteria bacterium]